MQQNTSKTFRIDYQREPPFKFSLAAEMKSEFIIIPEISNKVALFLKNDDFHVSARFFGYMSSVVGNGCFLIQLKRGHEKKITPDKASWDVIDSAELPKSRQNMSRIGAHILVRWVLI